MTMQFVYGNIKTARISRNLSQKIVGGKLGFTQNAYSKIELGKTKMTINTLFRLAVILDVDATTLLTERTAPAFSLTTIAQ